MASLCFFVQLPDRTPILAKGVFLCTSFGRSLFWNHSPSEWFSKYKKTSKGMIPLEVLVRPTGFEPAAYRVGVIRPSKKKPRFTAGFGYIAQN